MGDTCSPCTTCGDRSGCCMCPDPEQREQLVEAVLKENEELEREANFGDVATLLGNSYVVQTYLKIKQEVDPYVLGIVRDLFLEGRDVDAVAILATELELEPPKSLEDAGFIRVKIWNEGAGWHIHCDACREYFFHDKSDDQTERVMTGRPGKPRPMTYIGTWIQEHYATCIIKHPTTHRPDRNLKKVRF